MVDNVTMHMDRNSVNLKNLLNLRHTMSGKNSITFFLQVGMSNNNVISNVSNLYANLLQLMNN